MLDSPKNIDDYINSFPSDIQDILQEIRRVIRDAAPEAIEGVFYGIPSYSVYGDPWFISPPIRSI